MTDKGTASRDIRCDVGQDHLRRSNASRAGAQALWDSAQPIKGTKAEIYLRAHSIDFCPAELRYLANCPIDGEAHPAIIASVRDANGLAAVERTVLRRDGMAMADVPNPKRMLGLPLGGLGQWGASPVNILRLAEDVLEAASAMIVGSHGIPIWPVFGCERYATIDILPGIERIIIYTGPGQVAAQAIERAAPHLRMGGRTIDVIIPPGDASWNMYLKKIRV
jgi:hypothetical protein